MSPILRDRIRWVSIFLFCMAAPQYVFKFMGKALRPVVTLANEVVNTAESLGES